MSIHPAVKSLIEEIDAFRERQNMSVSAFGARALGDSNFIPDLLKRGRHPSFGTIDKLRAFMREQEPAA